MLTAEGVGKTFEPPRGWLRLLVRTAHHEPVHALHDVSLTVDPGQIVGLVGPNGAGKSTLIRICAGLLVATSGRVTIAGREVAAGGSHGPASLGLMLADERALYWRLTGRDNLRFFGVMAGLPPEEARARADELLERFGLASDDRRVFGYSTGMRVKLGLARAMVARPALLILDEPSRSLDPFASDELLGLLRELADGGTAVLLSSHRLDEVESICDAVVVLIGGRGVASMSMSELRSGEGRSVRQLLDAHVDRAAEDRLR